MAERVNAGTSNDSIIDVIKKHLGSAFKGPGWDALIAALAEGDKIVADNNRYAFDQLFKSTASGKYLYDRASDVGVDQPNNVGMSDELFRNFIIKKTAGKLTPASIMEILEIFYSPDATRANVTSGAETSATFEEGDELRLAIDNVEKHTVIFKAGTFTMAQVAAVVNRVFQLAGSKAYALAIVDPTTATNKLRLYSGSLGLNGAVQIAGGKAQNTLRFPTAIAIFGAFSAPTWSVGVPTPGLAKYTVTSGSATMPGGMIDVLPGDYVNIYGTNFQAANRGSFEIVEVVVDYPGPTVNFTVKNEAAVAQTGVVQANQSDIQVFRPTKFTLNNLQRAAYVSQSDDSGFRLTLPVTTQVVGRAENTGAYVQENDEIAISTVSRNASGVLTIVTSALHGLSVGDQLIIDGVTADAGAGVARFNDTYSVATVANGTTFTVNSRVLSTKTGTGGNITTFKAAAATVAGPYILDPEDGFSITGTEASLAADYTRFVSYSNLKVNSTAGFPDTNGWLVVGFGTQYETGPIPYYGVLDATRLKIGANFVFDKTVPAGSKVTVLAGKGPWAPAHPETAGLFYATDSASGLVAAVETVDSISAADSQISKNIIYPGDRGLGGESKPVSDIVRIYG